MRDRAAANAREVFRYLGELQRLLGLLSRAGVRAAVLKGVPLSLMAFGNVAMREVGDIDLLIQPSEAERTDALLQQSGLVRSEPAARLTPKQRAVHARHFKDYTYAPSNGFEVDLHWRLVRDSQIAECLLPSHAGTGPNSFTILQIGSLQVEVLTLERCLLYLSVHGALEGWPRWKSLTDIAALWTMATEAQRASASSIAQGSALASYLHAALTLATDWLGPLPESHRYVMEGERLSRYIVSYTRHQAAEQNFMPSASGVTTFAMKLHEARLHPSFRSRLEILGRILFRPRVWETIYLPDPLFFLYPLLSPVEWLLFRLKRRAAKQEKP